MDQSISGPLPWVSSDGGRAAAGFGGSAGDCVIRAICIATGQNYEQTFTDIFALAKASPSGGVSQRFYAPYLAARGWRFTYTGRKRLTAQNLPSHSTIIALMSAHAVAIVDGVIRDTYDCSVGGSRQFYGYFYYDDPREARARIARRIRGLLARTIENGATEAEAETALLRANELMAKHALTFKDISEVREEEYAEASTQIGTRNSNHAVIRFPVVGCLRSIAKFACCEHWFRGDKVVFYGTKLDTELAIWLVTLYGQQLDRDLADYQRSPDGRRSSEPPATRRANYISFWTGSRNRRLDDLHVARTSPPPRAGVRYTEGTELPAPQAEQVRSRELMIVREHVLQEKYESHTKDWHWGRPRRTRARTAPVDPRTRAAARSAEARGDLGIDRKLERDR